MIENENSRIVVGEGGWRGRLGFTPTSGTQHVVLHPEDGSHVLTLPVALLTQQENGTFHLPLTRSAAAEYSAQIGNGSEQIVVPVIEEVMQVQKHMVETGDVRIVKTVHEHEERIDEPLRRESVEVTRVPMDRVVDAAVPPHEEGDTLIIPIYEERLVVQKQLFLKEELHVTRRDTVDRHAQKTVVLRREEVAIERHTQDATADVHHTSSGVI